MFVLSSEKFMGPAGMHWAWEGLTETRKRSGKSPNICLKRHKYTFVFPFFSFQDINGRQFLSVMDLEDKTLHQDLPPHLSPGATEFTSIYTSSPTSAQLHMLATSVIQSTAATSEPQPTFPVPADLQQPTTHTGISSKDHYCLLNTS